MGVINVLDKHVAELIAAGEVVESCLLYTSPSPRDTR